MTKSNKVDVAKEVEEVGNAAKAEGGGGGAEAAPAAADPGMDALMAALADDPVAAETKTAEEGEGEGKKDDEDAPLTFATTFDQLSFDGGGTRGTMEVYMLRDVMNLVTIIARNPEKLEEKKWWKDFKFESAGTRNELRKDLDAVNESKTPPIHPTEVFDMIVGTSTGALISFGLVGGNKKVGRRSPMTVNEIVQLYETASPVIFEQPKGFMAGSLNNWSKKYGFLWNSYTQDGLEKELTAAYGKATLKDFNHLKCIAGAVARQHNENPNDPDRMELFDTRTGISYSVVDVLKATADAPIYFNTPTKVGDKNYVDGGVGGNCPLAQSLPRMRQMRPEQKANSVVSFAPPVQARETMPRDKQWKYWLKYFPQQFTDGNSVYMDTKNNNLDVIFQRLVPRSQEASTYKMDSLDISGMLEVMRMESLADPAYFHDVFMVALVIACRKTTVQTSLTMYTLTKNVFEAAINDNDYETGLSVAKASLRCWQSLENLPETLRKPYLIEAYYMMGRIFHAMGEFERSADGYDNCLNVAKNDVTMILKVATIYNSIGGNEYSIGRFERAKNFFDKSIALKVKMHGTDQHVEVASSYLNMAGCLAQLNKYVESLFYMEKSRSIFVANYGPVHPHVSSCLNNIAGIHFAFANYMEAKEYYNQSLKMKEAIYGDTKNKNESVALTHENLGLCALKTADYDEAEEHFDTALTISKAVHGETEYHPSIARELHGKAWLKELTGQVQEALTGYEKSLKMSRETYDNLKGQHPDVAKSLYHIGECLRKQAQLDKAQESLREAKNMIRTLNEEKQDPSDATLGECLVAYGSYHFDKGEMEKASKDYNQALEMRRDIYGEEADHDEIAECIFHLGRLARSEGNEAEAQEMFQESLDMYKKVFGEESQNAGKLEVEDEMSKKGKKAEGKKKKGSATKYKTEKIE